MPAALHDQAVATSRIRYCPICDGYEVTGRRIAVLGTGGRGLREAEFLRSYTAQVTLVAPDGPHDLTRCERDHLDAVGVALLDGPAREFALVDTGLAFNTAAGRHVFESAYPALGSHIHSDLARDLGADCTEDGCILVDSHQRTSIPGLYAAGDVVAGLDQMSTAFGHASIAATTIRNDQANRSPRLR
jgi:thioredoxin reductase (NADPH)